MGRAKKENEEMIEELKTKNKNAKEIANIELYATNMYGLFCPKISSVNIDFTHKFFIY